jgi:hypothetical protein
MELYVKTTENCEDCSSKNKDFYSWSENCSFIIEGVYSKKQPKAEKFILDVKKGDTVYALVLNYSTGDSYGSSVGKGELIWLFSEKDFAQRVYYEYMNNIREPLMYLMLEVDKKQFKRTKIGNVVNGFFESLLSLDIEEFKVL